MALEFNSQQFTANGTANSFSLDQTVNYANDVLVIVNGLVQLPDSDYYITNSNTINFFINPFSNSDIEIRYITDSAGTGYTGSSGFFGSTGFSGSLGYFGSTGFSGSLGFFGSTGFQGSAGAPGGDTGYTGSVGGLGFTGSQGSIGGVGKPTKSSRITGNGSNTQFTLAESTSNSNHIFVFTNGILETPDVDYYVVGTTLYFYNAPPYNSEIEIRYFDVAQGDVGFTGSVGFIGSTGYFGSLGFTGSVGFKALLVI